MEDETVNAELKAWRAVQVIGYSASDAVWIDFAVWLEGFLVSEAFLGINKVNSNHRTLS